MRGWKPLLAALGRAAWSVVAVPLFVACTPAGLLLRLVGPNPLRLRSAWDATSYWQAQTPTEDVASYLRPF
jgi:hypothetical protein